MLFSLAVFIGCESAPKQSPPPPASAAPVPEVIAAEDADILRLEELATDPDDRRVAILLHGYGSNEHDLVGLARRVGLGGPIVSFRAPEPAGNGFAWFPIDFTPGGTRYDADAADAAVKRVAANIRGVRLQHPGFETVVIGFSQGAMLTSMLAVEAPDAVDRAVALSGALPRPVEANGSSAPIFMAHGTADKVVPIERARQARDWLQAAGAAPAYREYDGLAHGTSPVVLSDVAQWLESPAP